MAKITRKKTDDYSPPVVVPPLTVAQACNEFQLQGTTRAHVTKRYAGELHTITEWSRIFRRDRVI